MKVKLATCLVWAAAALPAAPAAAQMCNVKVVTDASPDYHDLPAMIRSITGKWPATKDKCWAMFYWNHIARRQTAPMNLHGLDCSDPIRQFNDYGYTMCSTIAGTNCSIWDAMGLKIKYWDISAHTVSEVFYDGRWHIYDNSMSALYTLCDGTTIAGVEDVGKSGGCEASGGKVEPGHVARYHCLTATSHNGFLTGADCARDLAQEYRCFHPNALKYRYYFHDWDRGHRYILNLRDGEAYTRHYAGLGKTPEYYVPNHGKDPESVNTRYHIRGNGVRTFQPTLTAAGLPRCAHGLSGVKALEPSGVAPSGEGPGEVVFKIEGANVITSLAIQGLFERAGDDDEAALAVSTTNGLAWKEVWGNLFRADKKAGRTPVEVKLVEPVNGAYEVLVRVTIKGKAALREIGFRTVTMVNSKTQPKLLLGRNTVYVGLGEQTESIVLWPDLQGDAYKPYVVEEQNIATQAKHPGYMGVMHAAQPNQDAYVVFRIDAPRDITRVIYGGRLYNRAPKAHIDFLHSFDGGKTWTKSYSLTDTKAPWDVIRYEAIDPVPPGTRSVLMKYLLNASEAGTSACSIYAVRMEAHHKPADPARKPLDVTFNWSERQKDYSLVERSHTQLVEKLPCRYTIDVGGADQPVVNLLRICTKGAAGQAKYGYSDGKDAGGEKFVYRWVTYGRNFAEGKPYTVSVPSLANWGAGDPNGTKLTDGVVGPPYAGGSAPSSGLCWQKGQKPVVTVDLGKAQCCAAFRIHLTGGWPWWDALKGEVQDTVEVLTSLDGKSYTSQGFFDFRLRWKDIPINHMMPDDETAAGYVFALVPPKAPEARYVRFAITPQRILSVSEVQALDAVRYEPFDMRIALPDDPGAPGPPPAKQEPNEAPAPPAAKPQPPRLKVPATAQPPKIDGVLDDEAWQQAPPAGPFKLSHGEAPGAKTTLRVLQDSQCLYVAAECFDSPQALAGLAAKTAKHDGDGIWSDDDVEVFLDPTGERKSYYQVIVNSRGVTWDAWHDAPNHPDLSWEPRYRAAARVDKAAWTVELALPWSMFDRSHKNAPEWAFNCIRSRPAAGEVCYWSPVYARTAHTPDGFGTLAGAAGRIPIRQRPAAKPPPTPTVKTVFDFEEAQDLAGWSSLDLPDAKAKEPPVTIDRVAENATSGRYAMKLTFDGGTWPAVTTSQIPLKGNWQEFGTFTADVTAARHCLVGFRVLQEKSSRKDGWDDQVGRWEKTEFLHPGKNTVVGNLHPQDWSALKPDLGDVVRFEVYLYAPHKGESIHVDNVRVSTARLPPAKTEVRMTVPGTKLVAWGVNNVGQLIEQTKGAWKPAEAPASVAAVEAQLRQDLAKLKASHPRAVLAVFRDGQKGYDPAHPDGVYAGWSDTYVNSHGPDGNTLGRAHNAGKSTTNEVFMRHRSLLMRVDLGSIPTGSRILAARLVLVRSHGEKIDKPNLWVAEPCNRPWKEYEANAYEYAKDRFWKAVGGMDYGDDPDFLPEYVAYGPAQGAVNVWDFTLAVELWTGGKRENHGFFFHGAEYYWRAFMREAEVAENRPALLVIYEPPSPAA